MVCIAHQPQGLQQVKVCHEWSKHAEFILLGKHPDSRYIHGWKGWKFLRVIGGKIDHRGFLWSLLLFISEKTWEMPVVHRRFQFFYSSSGSGKTAVAHGRGKPSYMFLELQILLQKVSPSLTILIYFKNISLIIIISSRKTYTLGSAKTLVHSG